MLEPVVETTEEELFDTSPALFSKLLIRRCHIGSLKGKLVKSVLKRVTILFMQNLDINS